jgi:hypothetical protein
MATGPRANTDQRAEGRGAHRDVARLARRIHDIGVEAVASVVGARVEETARQWLAKTPLDANDPTSRLRVMEAFALASFLTLCSSSLLGVSPLERFIRQRRDDADELSRAALDVLAKTEFHLIQLKARRSPDRLDAEDLATGETLSLFDSDVPATAVSVRVAAWLAPLPGGDFVLLGPTTPLDPGALAEGLSFARPGKGLINARRCAAAVYKHVVRHGGLRVEGLNGFPEDAPDDRQGAEEGVEEDDALDRLASALRGARDGEGTGEIMEEARQMAAPFPLIQALVRSILARGAGRKDLAEAFSRIGFIMMETLDRRASIGSGGGQLSLDSIAAEIDRIIADRRATAETRALFDVLRRRLATTGRSGGADKPGDAELMRVLQLIQALRAKTVDQGCTEQEALASAKKVAELLDRYGLSLSEVEMRDQTCRGFGVDTGRKRRAPIDDCMPVVGFFCDCKVWGETGAANTIRFVFFGLPADVEAAHYLHDLIVATFETETAGFKRAELAKAGDGRRVSAHSFQIGLAHGICEKLTGLKAERDAANERASGRDLVPLKTSVIDEELEKLGLSFRAKSQNRKRKVSPDAYHAGRAAGRKFEPHRRVTET